MRTQIGNTYQPKIWLLQRLSAFVLAICSITHLITIIIAVKGGLTSAEIIERVGANTEWFIFYSTFIIAASIHAPIGIRTILKETTNASEIMVKILVFSFGLLISGLGMWSILGFYRLGEL